MNEIEKAKLTESAPKVYRTIHALNVDGLVLDHHVYTECTESDRILETTEFINKWMGNACEDNANMFKHYSVDTDSCDWTHTHNMPGTETANLTESEHPAYRTIHAYHVDGFIIAHHIYTECTESDRILETAEFMSRWTGNAYEGDNANMFKHYSVDTDSCDWTYIICTK